MVIKLHYLNMINRSNNCEDKGDYIRMDNNSNYIFFTALLIGKLHLRMHLGIRKLK